MSRLADLIAKARIPQLGADLAREFRALSARLAEIIQRLNELFHGDLTDGDQVVYVMNVIRGKLLESPMLRKQAGNNPQNSFRTRLTSIRNIGMPSSIRATPTRL